MQFVFLDGKACSHSCSKCPRNRNSHGKGTAPQNHRLLSHHCQRRCHSEPRSAPSTNLKAKRAGVSCLQLQKKCIYCVYSMHCVLCMLKTPKIYLTLLKEVSVRLCCILYSVGLFWLFLSTDSVPDSFETDSVLWLGRLVTLQSIFAVPLHF